MGFSSAGGSFGLSSLGLSSLGLSSLGFSSLGFSSSGFLPISTALDGADSLPAMSTAVTWIEPLPALKLREEPAFMVPTFLPPL
ncbi:hypothetical protein LG298_21460 [Cytobacillus firmus]